MGGIFQIKEQCMQSSLIWKVNTSEKLEEGQDTRLCAEGSGNHFRMRMVNRQVLVPSVKEL